MAATAVGTSPTQEGANLFGTTPTYPRHPEASLPSQDLKRQLYPPPSYLVPDDDVLSTETERENVGVGGLPSETQLMLLCLDYLRNLRRSYGSDDLRMAEGLDADWLSVACYALSRSFVRPKHMRHRDHRGDNGEVSGSGNDAWFDPENGSHHSRISPLRRRQVLGMGSGSPRSGEPVPALSAESVLLPGIEEIEAEILSERDPKRRGGMQGKADFEKETVFDPETWYAYDDSHQSNSHRFYPLNGLTSYMPASSFGIVVDGPLSLGEIAAAGLTGLGARTRLDAEREMVRTPLFDQFLNAVSSKGFFDVNDAAMAADGTVGTPSEVGSFVIAGEGEPSKEELEQRRKVLYEERYRKVLSKFRSKLATKATSTASRQGSFPMGGMSLGTFGGASVVGPSAPGDTSVLSVGSAGLTAAAVSAAERQRRRRVRRIEACAIATQGGGASGAASPAVPLVKGTSVSSPTASLQPSSLTRHGRDSPGSGLNFSSDISVLDVTVDGSSSANGGLGQAAAFHPPPL